MSWWTDITSTKNSVRGATVRYGIYPALDDTDISAAKSFVKLTAGAAKQMDHAAEDILTALTAPATEYWICQVLVHTVAAELMAVRLQDAAAVKLAEVFLDCTAAKANLPARDLPFPIKMAGAAVVKGILGSITGGNNLYIALLCATLL